MNQKHASVILYIFHFSHTKFSFFTIYSHLQRFDFRYIYIYVLFLKKICLYDTFFHDSTIFPKKFILVYISLFSINFYSIKFITFRTMKCLNCMQNLISFPSERFFIIRRIKVRKFESIENTDVVLSY